VLITISSGIGEVLSRELVQREWSVIEMARPQDKLAAIQKELGDLFMQRLSATYHRNQK
jgi:NADP-dependent 3-hydroxy acid dehydrogenase YdfG